MRHEWLPESSRRCGCSVSPVLLDPAALRVSSRAACDRHRLHRNSLPGTLGTPCTIRVSLRFRDVYPPQLFSLLTGLAFTTTSYFACVACVASSIWRSLLLPDSSSCPSGCAPHGILIHIKFRNCGLPACLTPLPGSSSRSSFKTPDGPAANHHHQHPTQPASSYGLSWLRRHAFHDSLSPLDTLSDLWALRLIVNRPRLKRHHCSISPDLPAPAPCRSPKHVNPM